MTLRFLTRSAAHNELMLLLAIHGRDGLSLPADPSALPAGVLEQVPLARLIDDGILTRSESPAGARLMLTRDGLQHLRQLVIDYHLELMNLRRASDDFLTERVRMLQDHGCRRVLFYGASDTALALLEVLDGSSIEVLAVLDDDPAKQGTVLGGVPVIAPDQAPAFDVDSIVVTTVAFQDQILQKGSRLTPNGERLIGLFDLTA